MHNAIVWHDARTKAIVDEIIENHGQDYIHEDCGLPISTYFSASKVRQRKAGNRQLIRYYNKGS